MLVLTRKTDQKIQIGDDITVTVIQVKGRYVRLGIDAPANIRILRTELTHSPAPQSKGMVPGAVDSGARLGAIPLDHAHPPSTSERGVG
jgi:carbon storage regulator CsrA